MLRPCRVHHALLGLATAAAFGWIGCTYDWDVGPESAQAQDAGPDASAECSSIIAALAQQRPEATACLAAMAGVECSQSDVDECGCKIGGLDPIPFESYLALVAEFHQKGCSVACSACPPSSLPPKCKADESGGQYHCQSQ